MAALTVYQPSLHGAAVPLTAAAAGGDTFVNDGKTYLKVRNAHASAARTVTVDSTGTCNFGAASHAAHDAVASVAGPSEEELGPFPVEQFGTTCSVSYSDSAADLTVAAVRRG